MNIALHAIATTEILFIVNIKIITTAVNLSF